jgi:hypothetical protein
MATTPRASAADPRPYPVPDDPEVGPVLLERALVALGRLPSLPRLQAAAGRRWYRGTTAAIDLARAARAAGCELPTVRKTSAPRARRLLLRLLRRRIPVLLPVDDWTSWILVHAAEGKHFLVDDPETPAVLDLVSWPSLRARWRRFDIEYSSEDPPELFHLHPVVPQFRVSIQADFSAARVRFLRRAENRELSRHWNDYLEDLLEISRPPSPRQSEPLSMAEFLRRHQKMLVQRATFWHGGVSALAVGKLLRNFRVVAETYGLVIPLSVSRRALADLAILTALWASASAGLAALYGVPRPEKRKRRKPKKRRRKPARRKRR